MMALDPKKLRLIQLARRRLGLEESAYRDILWRAAGVRSAKDLDDWGFAQLMYIFERLGFKSDFAEANLGNRDGMASPPQIAFMRDLWSKFTDGEGDDASLGKWLEGRFGVSSLRFVDAPTARKAIGGLIAMNKRKAAKAATLASAKPPAKPGPDGDDAA